MATVIQVQFADSELYKKIGDNEAELRLVNYALNETLKQIHDSEENLHNQAMGVEPIPYTPQLRIYHTPLETLKSMDRVQLLEKLTETSTTLTDLTARLKQAESKRIRLQLRSTTLKTRVCDESDEPFPVPDDYHIPSPSKRQKTHGDVEECPGKTVECPGNGTFAVPLFKQWTL